MNKKMNRFILTVIFLTCLVLHSCVIRIGKGSMGYDTKGVRIPPECKTAYVPYIQNRAALVQPLLSRNITEKLRDKILAQTPLKLTNSNGDVNFEGSVENYSTQPMAPQGGNNITAALNRLSVTVSVKYSNAKDPQWDYDTKFTRYLDYASSSNLSDIENSDDFNKLVDQLVQDIFEKAFINW